MRLRQFTVPFEKVVGEEATELEFGPDDYLVVRPLFGLSRDEIAHWTDRIAEVESRGKEALRKEDGETDAAYRKRRKAAEDAADSLVLDMLRQACVEWHLTGPDGEAIPMPGTSQALGSLPGGLAGSLYNFLSNYRGEGPNPTNRQ